MAGYFMAIFTISWCFSITYIGFTLRGIHSDSDVAVVIHLKLIRDWLNRC